MFTCYFYTINKKTGSAKQYFGWKRFLAIERVKTLQCSFLRTSKTHSLEWLPRGNNEGNLNHSAAQATAVNTHHCVIIIRALVRDKTHLAKARGNEDTKNPIQAKPSGQRASLSNFNRPLAFVFTFCLYWGFYRNATMILPSSLYTETLKMQIKVQFVT